MSSYQSRRSTFEIATPYLSIALIPVLVFVGKSWCADMEFIMKHGYTASFVESFFIGVMLSFVLLALLKKVASHLTKKELTVIALLSTLSIITGYMSGIAIRTYIMKSITTPEWFVFFPVISIGCTIYTLYFYKKRQTPLN